MTSRSQIFLFSSFLILGACGGGSQSASSDSKSASSGQPAMKSPVDPATASTISGSVKFSGAKPALKNLNMRADAFCKTQHSTNIKSDEVVVNPNGTLKNVYVYVKSGLGTLTFPIPSEPVALDQKGCMYVPHVIAAQTGQTITIRNSDGVLHNVNARPKSNKGFNVGQPVKGMESKKSFGNAEVGIPLKCDVHPWMKSYISVQPHPYAAVTGDNGSFNLPNLPPGTYEVEAWHEKYGTAVQKITVGAKESKSITFTFKGA